MNIDLDTLCDVSFGNEVVIHSYTVHNIEAMWQISIEERMLHVWRLTIRCHPAVLIFIGHI